MLNPKGIKGQVTPDMQQFFDLEQGIFSHKKAMQNNCKIRWWIFQEVQRG